MKSNYHEKKQARIEAYERLAEKNKQESDAQYKKSHDMASVIPFGQPILVGHHSEKRDRSYRNKIGRAMDKSVEASQKARHYASKAQAAESNTAISSDDPEAIVKLKEKLAKLETQQEQSKTINKCVRKNDRAGLIAMGLSEVTVEKLFIPDFANRTGIPSYVLTNNSAEIRRLKKRIEEEQTKAGQETSELTVAGIRIVDSVEDNRFQIFFPGKPSEAIRSKLKQNGFRWASSVGAWMRNRVLRSDYLLTFAREVVEQYVGEGTV